MKADGSTSGACVITQLVNLLKLDFHKRHAQEKDSNYKQKILSTTQSISQIIGTIDCNIDDKDSFGFRLLQHVSQIPCLLTIVTRERQILSKIRHCCYSVRNRSQVYMRDQLVKSFDIHLSLSNSVDSNNTYDIYDALTDHTRVKMLDGYRSCQNIFLHFGNTIDIYLNRSIDESNDNNKNVKNLKMFKIDEIVNFGLYKYCLSITQDEFDKMKRNDIFSQITNSNYPNNNGNDINDMYQCTGVVTHNGGYYSCYNYDGEARKWIQFDDYDDRVSPVDWITVLKNSHGNDGPLTYGWNCPTAVKFTYKRVTTAQITRAEIDHAIQQLL